MGCRPGLLRLAVFLWRAAILNLAGRWRSRRTCGRLYRGVWRLARRARPVIGAAVRRALFRNRRFLVEQALAGTRAGLVGLLVAGTFLLAAVAGTADRLAHVCLLCESKP